METSSRLLCTILLATLAAASRASAAGNCRLQELGEMPVTMDGLKPMVDVSIDGAPARLIADSGGFFNLIGDSEVDRLKLRPGPLGGPNTRFAPDTLVKGVNGVVRAQAEVARVVSIPGHSFEDVRFLVAPNHYSTQASGLLGQNFLNVSDTEYDLANGVIRLFKPSGCANAVLTYWAGDKPYSVITVDPVEDHGGDIRGRVSVNGVEIEAVFDTGSSRSVLSLHGAAKAGINRTDPDLRPGGVTSGIGRRLEQTWIAPVQSFKVGDEEIRNTHLRVGDIDIEGADMLIGADFFLSHRILVANTQKRLYLTYNGGPVFDLGVANDEAAPVAGAEEPTTAQGFIRRAEASSARREYAQAIADYTKAVGLSPKDSGILLARGRTYAADHQPRLALADFDQALRLKPDDVGVLMTRGALQLQEQHPDLARADFDAAASHDRQLLVLIGAAYTNAGLYPQAIAALDAWLSDPPKDADVASALNDRCWTRALWNRELGKALADCDASLKLDSRNLNFHNSRGVVLMRLGRDDEAIREYDSILREQPNAAWPLYLRGAAKLDAGRAADGETDLKTAVAIDPTVTARAQKDGLAREAAAASGASPGR